MKMAEDDYAALEDNQVLVQVGAGRGGARAAIDCMRSACWVASRANFRGWLEAARVLAGNAAESATPAPCLQGMMASRFVATFRDEVTAWNKKLNAVADVVQLMAEIQRSWACECQRQELLLLGMVLQRRSRRQLRLGNEPRVHWMTLSFLPSCARRPGVAVHPERGGAPGAARGHPAFCPHRWRGAGCACRHGGGEELRGVLHQGGAAEAPGDAAGGAGAVREGGRALLLSIYGAALWRCLPHLQQRLLSPKFTSSHSTHQLGTMQALADFMESKRRAFPRFYFVSSSDLLEILSVGSTPPHCCCLRPAGAVCLLLRICCALQPAGQLTCVWCNCRTATTPDALWCTCPSASRWA